MDNKTEHLREDQKTVPISSLGMVYDESRDRVIIFSGLVNESGVSNNNPPLFDDTIWEWDGTQWETIPVTSEKPSIRVNALYAYDPINQTTIMYGGQTTTGSASNDMWNWDGTSWTKIDVQGDSPFIAATQLVFIPSKNLFFTHGGVDTHTDIWVMPRKTWAFQLPQSGIPNWLQFQ